MNRIDTELTNGIFSKDNYAALIRLTAEKGRNALETFLVQQNIIQFYLMWLIRLRSKIPNKNLRDWIENQTLGNLIRLYRICAKRDDQEINFVKMLETYNERRRYLVHKIVIDCDWAKVRDEAKNANKEGLEIIKQLEKMIYGIAKTLKAGRL